MSFASPIVVKDDFASRGIEWTAQPASGFTPTIGVDYAALASDGTTGPSRFVNVTVTGSYQFTLVGRGGAGMAGVGVYLVAGYNHELRARKVEVVPGGGAVTFLW